jgi:hypothetical protein
MRSALAEYRSALLLVLLVVATGALHVSPLQDPVTGAPSELGARSLPTAYLMGAPLFGAWDSLSLLTLSQHYAVLVTLVALYASWRLRSIRAGSTSLARESGLAGVTLAVLLLFYAAGMLLPRPMTGIDLVDDDLVAIDFHSHTNHSHDGWSLFTADRNRAWHEAGGFDVAYVTDHYTWRGVDEAAAKNPGRAGDGTVLISGAEIRIHLRPTNVLGDRSRYLFALDADSVYMDPDSIAAGFARGGLPPTLLYTMPGGLQYVLPFTERLPSGVIGIELNDGSPRGLEQVRAERAAIIALADSQDLALVGAANLHGWGRTVASWSVMRIPGWQEAAPEELGAEIERLLHERRRDAVEIVERRMPYHGGSPLLIALTLPWLTLEHFRMLALPERVAWVVWIGIGAVLSRRRRRPDETRPAGGSGEAFA